MIYDLIAPFYDSVNSSLDYSEWADFIEKTVEKEYGGRPELVLDLATGTGRMALELASRGYDMTGVDSSVEMLGIAREEAERRGLSGILWLCQDMTDFELYGTVDLVTCCLDSINHLTSPEDLKRCFSLVHNYLSPNGLFLFDINGKKKFETVYSDRSYVMEEDGAVCVWQNSYSDESELCDFMITVFEEQEDGSYLRYDEVESERMYRLDAVKGELLSAGFEFIGAYSDFKFTEASDDDERIYIAARCIKR
ncbi:MAG: class I SAM-dependent methyltransferase [Clostridia bacterium]|nr:class I SAM-dependent methyltransferase [Clostridia bacterium]